LTQDVGVENQSAKGAERGRVYNGNKTEWSSIRSVIRRVINKIGRSRSGSPIC